jgi:archaellum component FlaC
VSGGDPDLYIDLDAADLLGSQLGQIKSSLDDAMGTVEGLDGRLGSPRAVDGFKDFIDGWKDGRQKILGEIDEIVDKLKGAVHEYQENETRIAKAAHSGG